MKKKKGSIMVLSAFFILIIVSSIISIHHINKAVVRIMDVQNKSDAHMYSLIAFYAETLDKVSWINKQLRRIGVLSALIVFAPELAPLITLTQKIAEGLQAYQDILLLKLKTYAPILDNKLRLDNGLRVPGNIHYFKYRRQPAINLGFMTIPGLIEIDPEIFNTACIRHSGIINDSESCLYSEDYMEQSSWFAPTEESWGIFSTNVD
jgi:hypothetical protein